MSRIWRSFVPMMLATAFGQVNLLIDNAFASALPTGSITILGFAYVIISNAQLLTIYVIVQVAFPRMVHAAIDDPAGLLDTMRTHMRYLLLVAAPMAAGALTFGLPLARALFERGAFPASSSRGVATVLACYAAHILLMGHLLLLARLLIVRGRLASTALISTVAIALNALLDWLLLKPMGLYGIALSTTLVTTSYFLVLVPLALKETPGLFARGERLHATKVLACAAAMGLFLRGWEVGFERIYNVAGEAARVLELGSGICLGGLFYVLLLRWMGVHEPMEVIRKLVTGPRLLRNEG
jgi:putative peptidoglycan lipid II flippase